MKLTIGKPLKQKTPPKNTYRITISTMEGDGDDYHTVVIDTPTDTEVFRLYSEYLQLRKQDTDEYNYLSFFECSVWQDQIHINCDLGHHDSLEDFEVTWFNEDGIEHAVKFTKSSK